MVQVLFGLIYNLCLLFVYDADEEMSIGSQQQQQQHHQQQQQQQSIESIATSNAVTALTHTPRYLSADTAHLQGSPSAQQSSAHNALAAQQYGVENSNFGPFYHHHSHIPSYGNPYEKFKIPSTAHTRRATSPYHGTYQGFYGTAAHHQLGRPNGYIDLVPR